MQDTGGQYFLICPLLPLWLLALGLLFVHFLHLHPPVLEPDLNLPLRQVQHPGDLVTAVPGEVHVKKKLLFELQSLVLGVRTSLLPCGSCVYPVCHWVICGYWK